MTRYFEMKCTYYGENSPISISEEEYLVTFDSLENTTLKPVIDGQEFPPRGESWCIVRREDVKPLEGGSALVKILVQYVDEEKKTIRIGIHNSPDQKIDSFLIPLPEPINRN